jgi:uncharacterized protein (DUF885 family)
LPKTKENWALGPEKFERLLKLRGLGMDSDEIYNLGMNYLRSLKEERARLVKEIAPGKTVEEVLKLIEQRAPKSFEEALEATRKQMEVVTRPKDSEGLKKNLNYPNIVNTAVHEGFPGHFLQSVVSNRGSFVRLLGMLSAIETMEGWAHYCEEMMMEHGFNRSPQVRFVQVNDAIWRAVRIIIDVKLSRGEMSFDEAVDMLMKETGMSREAAVAEVKRYTLTPGYQLSYLLGKYLLLRLKDEVKQKMGAKFSERFFHDTIVANGGLPVFLLRKVFDLKLARLKAD